MLLPELGADLMQSRFDIHGAEAAQAAETAVHFGHQTARAGALGGMLGPQMFFGKAFGQVFADRKAVPDDELIIDQQRHLADG